MYFVLNTFSGTDGALLAGSYHKSAPAWCKRQNDSGDLAPLEYLRHSDVYTKSVPEESIGAMRRLESVIGSTGGHWTLN
jgi:hypothetical protein